MDVYFPIRDKNNNPSYREYQREAIVEAWNHLKYNKFVGINGPVGSGKSAINVTLARLIDDDPSAYLTPLVHLQDQIINENWPGMSSVKGKGNYLCAHAQLDENHERFVACDEEGEFGTPCSNSDGFYRVETTDMKTIGDEIDKLNDRYKNFPAKLSSMTSFKSSDEFDNFIKYVQDIFDAEYEKMLLSNKENAKHKSALGEACCQLHPIECPVKSSKLKAKFSKIAVMNPDVLYYINLSPKSVFRNLPMMIIDECHDLEGVVGRLFKVRLPIDTLSEIFNLDFTEMKEVKTEEEIFIAFCKICNTRVEPLCAIGKVLLKIQTLLTVTNYDSLFNIQSQTDMVNDFVKPMLEFFQEKDKNWEYPLIDLLNEIFSGQDIYDIKYGPCQKFASSVRKYFNELCDEFDCPRLFLGFKETLEHFQKFIPPAYIQDKFFTYCKRKAKSLKMELKEVQKTESIFRIYAYELNLILKNLHRMLIRISAMDKMKEDKSVYIISKLSESKRNACSEMPYLLKYFDQNDYRITEQLIDIVPLNTGRIIKCVFYSRAEKVVLSSGTWVNPTSLCNTYGLPEDCKIINIKSTFPVENRPIYVIQDNTYPNFSEVDDEKTYLYKTCEGINHYLSKLKFVIDYARGYVWHKHNKFSNVIVHAHTYEIVRAIAKYSNWLDDGCIFQLKDGEGYVKNDHTGKIYNPVKKSDILDFIGSKEDKGYTLITPSMSEGVDFKYDLARIQIILKRPTPNMGDPYIKAKIHGSLFAGLKPDKSYFDSFVYTTLVQQYGRIIRAKDDWGYTIIMDQSIVEPISKLLMRHNKIGRKKMNIDYFLEAIQYEINSDGSIKFLWFQ